MMLSNRSSKVYNALHLSLLQDLKHLNELNHNISIENSIVMNSWFRPNNPVTYGPGALLAMKFESDENYINCLEIIIDRIHSILGAFLDLLNRSVINDTIQRNVSKPNKLTLSLITSSLYEKIKHLSRITEIQKEQKTVSVDQKQEEPSISNNYGTADKGSQANTKTTQCPCCLIAQRCIKSIAEELAKTARETYTAEAREKMKSRIFKCSQEESLDLITGAVKADIHDLIERNKTLKDNLDILNKDFEKVEISSNDYSSRIDELEKSICELQECRVEEIRKQSVLRDVASKLLLEKRRIEQDMKANRDQVKQLENVIESQSANITELRSELGHLEANNRRLTSLGELLNAEKDLYKVRFERVRDERTRIKAKYGAFVEDLRGIEGYVVGIENRCLGLEEILVECRNLNDNVFGELNEIFQHVKDVVAVAAILQSNLNCYDQHVNSRISPNEINGTIEDIKIKGDPLFDMKQQIESNQKNIDKMQRQNEMLIKTVQKFQQHQTNSI